MYPHLNVMMMLLISLRIVISNQPLQCFSGLRFSTAQIIRFPLVNIDVVVRLGGSHCKLARMFAAEIHCQQCRR